MTTLRRGFQCLVSYAPTVWLAFICLIGVRPAAAINITISYIYDTNNFFGPQERKDALQAAADRYNAVITETLLGASLPNNNLDPRIGFRHPGTGAQYEVSSATNTADDAVFAIGAPAASEYRGPWSIAADEWILYAGGRSLSVAGEGGTGTGTNIVFGGPANDVFDLGTSHLNRGFRTTGSPQHLPVWGGSITFDNDGSTNWHFNPSTTPPNGTLDFYTIALHEIGHALGLSAESTDWDSLKSGSQFLGPQALAAYNADNGTSISALNQVSSTNRHWQDGTYDSRIFQNGNPKLVSTVGTGGLQDLLMEPTANTTLSVKRFELTNTDVGALRDIGWSTLPQIDLQPGDYNKDGTVNAADYVAWAKGQAGGGDYATWRANFGESLAGASPAAPPFASTVPEPASWLFLFAAISAVFVSRRPPRKW